MQICKKCGAVIKYIAIDSEYYAVVDPELLDVVSENGYKHKAYKKHVCQDVPESEEKNAGE